MSLKRADQYEGTVVGHEPRKSKNKTVYALRIKFSPKESEIIEFTSKSASKPPSHAIGDKIIIFHHSDGSLPDILSFPHLYLGFWIWLLVSVGAIGAILIPEFLPLIYLRK